MLFPRRSTKQNVLFIVFKQGINVYGVENTWSKSVKSKKEASFLLHNQHPSLKDFMFFKNPFQSDTRHLVHLILIECGYLWQVFSAEKPFAQAH